MPKASGPPFPVAMLLTLLLSLPAFAQRPIGLIVGRSASDIGQQTLERALRPLNLVVLRQASLLAVQADQPAPRVAIICGREIPPADLEAIRKFVEAGGKLLLVGDVDAAPLEPLGLKPEPVQLPAPLPSHVIIAQPPFSGCPERLIQQPLILVRYSGEGFREFGAWETQDRQDTGIPFGFISDRAIALSSDLMPGDPDGVMQLVASALGALDPELLDHLAAQTLAAAGRFGRFSSLGMESLDPFLRAAGAKTKDSPLADQVSQALAAYDEARQALADGRFAETIAKATHARRLLHAAYVSTFPSRDGELRAVWCHVIPETDWESQAEAIAGAGFNAIFAYTSNAAHAYYSSAVLPRAVYAPEADPLADCIRAAQVHGLEVFAWHAAFHALDASEERAAALRSENRLVRAPDGRALNWLCPSRDDNVKLLAVVVTELLAKYDLAGVVLDFARLPNRAFCYCDACRGKFEEQHGAPVANWPGEAVAGLLQPVYRRFLCSQVTQALAAMADAAHQARPSAVVAATVFPDPDTSGFEVAQDWEAWLATGKLDILCPLNYQTPVEELPGLIRRQAELAQGRADLCIGFEPAAPRRLPVAPGFLCEIIDAARCAGADGVALRGYSPAADLELFPALAAGPFAQPTLPPHRGPQVTYQFSGQPLPELRPTLFAEDADVTATIVAQAQVPMTASFEPLARDHEPTRPASLDPTGGPISARLATGFYRLAVAPGDAKAPRWVVRSPIIEVADQRTIADLRLAAERAARIDVALLENSRGSRSVWQDLARYADEKVTTGWIRELTRESLEPFDVLILSDPSEPQQVFSEGGLQTLRAWVGSGRGILVIYGTAGLGGIPPLFPQIGDPMRGGRSNALEVEIAREPHPLLERFTPGHRFRLANPDHLWMEVGGFGKALAADRGAEHQAVLVAGDYLDGRVVLCGFTIGFSAERDIPVAPNEANILIAAIRWLGKTAVK